MSFKKFLIGLFITSLVQVCICLLMIYFIAPLKMHLGFVFVTVGAMILFSVLLFGAAKVYARSSLVRLYIQLIMIAVFLKMLLCLALIIGYKKGFEPADNSFIWPFLFIYLSSTIYEVIYMDRVGREKHVSKI